MIASSSSQCETGDHKPKSKTILKSSIFLTSIRWENPNVYEINRTHKTGKIMNKKEKKNERERVIKINVKIHV